MKKGAGAVSRQSGGMRPSFGGFDSERLEDQATQGAVQQKALQQQAGNTGTVPGASKGGKTQQPAQSQQPAKPPRDLGTFKQELITRPVADVKEGLTSLFDLHALLGINPDQDTPEEKQKKIALHKRFQQLTQAEQQVAKQKYQQEIQKKQAEEKAKQEKKQQEEQAKQATIAPPAGKSDKPGLFMPGQKSSKQRAQNRLQQQMKTIGMTTDGG